jgi:acyl-CoA thioester hydrolase
MSELERDRSDRQLSESESGFETYRGMVKAWECDTVAHLTTAYYYERLGDATLNMFAMMGLGPEHIESERKALASVRCETKFRGELRAGDILHMRSGVISHDERGAVLGHRVFDSTTGQLCTELTLQLRYMDLESRRGILFTDELRARADQYLIPWDPGPSDWRTIPEDPERYVNTVFDTVKPWEIDVLGHMSVSFYIHRFSSATTQMNARIGLSPHTARSTNVGFSTFEFQVRFARELHAGQRVRIRSTIAEIGRTSIRVVNQLFDAHTGKLAAELSQFGVQLDMNTRRPRPLDEQMRAKAIELGAVDREAPAVSESARAS